MHFAASAQPTEAATEVEVAMKMEGRGFKSEGRSCGEAELHDCHAVRPSERRYGIWSGSQLRGCGAKTVPELTHTDTHTGGFAPVLMALLRLFNDDRLLSTPLCWVLEMMRGMSAAPR